MLLLIVVVYVVTVRFPQQQFVKIQFCKEIKGKPLKQFFVWEVPLPQLWKVLPEYDEQFFMWGVPIQMECTARTCWICLFRIYSVTWNWHWILTRQFICHKCHFEIHKDKRRKNKGRNFQDFEDNLICWIWKNPIVLNELLLTGDSNWVAPGYQ